MAHTATTTGAGWQFTVTGLNQASKYAYTMEVKNASQKSIKTYTGEFVTDGYTDLLPLLYEDNSLPFREGLGVGFVKFIHNGRLLIERNGILYNAHGARVK